MINSKEGAITAYIKHNHSYRSSEELPRVTSLILDQRYDQGCPIRPPSSPPGYAAISAWGSGRCVQDDR